TSSFAKSSGGTISARAARERDFKRCCMTSGRHDGSNRNHYFQGVGASPPLRLEAAAHAGAAHGGARSAVGRGFGSGAHLVEGWFARCAARRRTAHPTP